MECCSGHDTRPDRGTYVERHMVNAVMVVEGLLVLDQSIHLMVLVPNSMEKAMNTFGFAIHISFV